MLKVKLIRPGQYGREVPYGGIIKLALVEGVPLASLGPRRQLFR